MLPSSSDRRAGRVPNACDAKHHGVSRLRACAGEGAARGVEGQVQQLLQDSQDPANLGRLYVGWAPWL